MSIYVVDASVAAKWFFEEEYAEAALRVLNRDNELHAPDLLLAEFDNLMCKRIRRGDIPEPEGSRVRATLRRYPIRVYDFLGLLDSAYRTAVRTRRGLYDCLYVALAVHLDAQMVTADRRLYEALAEGPFARHVVWVEDVT